LHALRFCTRYVTGSQGSIARRTTWTDFFNPVAQTFFWSQLKKGIFQVGMDSWWMDASEPEFDVLKGKQTFLGTGESVRNAYQLYVTKAMYEGQRATTDRKRVVILTRSAFAGQTKTCCRFLVGRH
jgi:alpha-D-xyloside xylohydrolase